MLPFKPYRASSYKGRGQAASAYWLLPDKSVHTDLRGGMHPRRATTDVPRPVNSSRPQCVRERQPEGCKHTAYTAPWH